MNNVRTMLETRVPGLHARIEETLVEAEARFNRQANQPPSEFLLEHSRRTAAIAHQISRMEGVDAFLPDLVALYHDAGKFHNGAYHADGVPEEEHAADLAGSMLAEFGVESSDIDSVRQALRALYDDCVPCLGPSRIVQDADRLDKLGPIGVGAFFTKAALRGRGLVDALVHALSRELTYALAAPRSMFTETGKKLAVEHAAKTISFFDDLLRDLERWGIAVFERRTIVLEEGLRTRDGSAVPRLEVAIVMPRVCPDCEGALRLTHARKRGVKCEKLVASFACQDCSYAGETRFCLPILA